MRKVKIPTLSQMWYQRGRIKDEGGETQKREQQWNRLPGFISHLQDAHQHRSRL